MSTDQASDQCNVGLVCRDLKCWLTVEVVFEDVIDSCDALFHELHMQYKQLVTKFDSSIESRLDGQHLDFLFPMGGFLLLLRNCLVILPFLEFEGSILLEKCGILVTILGSLCSSDLRSKVPGHNIRNGMSFSSFKREISDACKYSPDGSTAHEKLHASMCFPKQIVSGASFLCSVLEIEHVSHAPLHLQLNGCGCLFVVHQQKGGDDPISNFSGAQDVLSGTSQNAPCNVNMIDVQVENENETCNGEDFLKCRGVSLDQDGDLAEFIACTPGKDYSTWWKRRERYRGWKHGLWASKKKERRRMGRHESWAIGFTQKKEDQGN